MNTVYLLHFSPPYKHAQHYLGISRNNRNVIHRWIEHKNGNGANLVKIAKNNGSLIILSRIWKNVPSDLERKLKGRSLKPLCPICKKQNRNEYK